MENKPSNGQPGNAGRRSRILSAFMTLVLIFTMANFLWSALKVDTESTSDEYYQIIQYFDDDKISEYSLNLTTRKLTYVLRGEKEKRTYTVPSYDLFIADVHDSVREYNKENPDEPIKMNYDAGTSSSWLIQILPMALMLILMFLMLYWVVKKMGNTMMDDTRRTMAFGKARLKTGDEARKTTFDDVAGLNEEKEDLEEIVEFLRNPERFNDLGARIPKGVLLVGPPGTGKTLLARAVAGEADAHFLSISGSDFVEMYVGVGASRVRDLFDNAKKNKPSIVFIDEIDAVGRQRGAGMGGGHDEREQTLNQLLVEMDGFGENAGVIIMAATNRPDILDPALLRPGRFDRQITVNYPDVQGREAILKVHARNKPIGPDVRLDEIARATSGFTGADLENLLNEAALLAARRKKKAITKFEIEEATIKVVVGTEKKSKKIHDDEKRLTAYHEAGHAITNYYLSTLDPVHQISIIPRGMAGGYTMSLPAEDKSYVSKKHMLDELVSLLGGRVAEAIILGDISTGASNDIERATKIARNMIIKYGMSEKLGPICYGSSNDEVFIGRDYGHIKNYSEETAAEIDKEIESLIMAAYSRADEILRLHIDQLHLLARYLIKFEKIDGSTFVELMSNPDFNFEEDSDEEGNDDNSKGEPEAPADDRFEKFEEKTSLKQHEEIFEKIVSEKAALAESSADSIVIPITEEEIVPEVEFTASTLVGDVSLSDSFDESLPEESSPLVEDVGDAEVDPAVQFTASTIAGNISEQDYSLDEPEDNLLEPLVKEPETEFDFVISEESVDETSELEFDYLNADVEDDDADINDYLEPDEADNFDKEADDVISVIETIADTSEGENTEDDENPFLTENEEIFALYELLKDTRDFGDGDDSNPSGDNN